MSVAYNPSAPIANPLLLPETRVVGTVGTVTASPTRYGEIKQNLGLTYDPLIIPKDYRTATPIYDQPIVRAESPPPIVVNNGPIVRRSPGRITEMQQTLGVTYNPLPVPVTRMTGTTTNDRPIMRTEGPVVTNQPVVMTPPRLGGLRETLGLTYDPVIVNREYAAPPVTAVYDRPIIRTDTTVAAPPVVMTSPPRYTVDPMLANRQFVAPAPIVYNPHIVRAGPAVTGPPLVSTPPRYTEIREPIAYNHVVANNIVTGTTIVDRPVMLGSPNVFAPAYASPVIRPQGVPTDMVYQERRYVSPPRTNTVMTQEGSRVYTSRPTVVDASYRMGYTRGMSPRTAEARAMSGGRRSSFDNDGYYLPESGRHSIARPLRDDRVFPLSPEPVTAAPVEKPAAAEEQGNLRWQRTRADIMEEYLERVERTSPPKRGNRLDDDQGIGRFDDGGSSISPRRDLF
eukprot:TRINITY_DN2862_c0_g1_i2.p1 TRINITY_DN2862_c0_g1~~TRINITY_DN2862_c0_g1_i2.p1  ORF type:complete len:455 (-),score=44.77 TRINITY_DN2862_c0_g1_i2:187-1551(-)